MISTLRNLFRRRTYSDLTLEQKCMARALSMATPNTNLRQAILPDDWRPKDYQTNASAYAGKVVER